MVEQIIKKGIITKKNLWFSPQVKPSLLNTYYQSRHSGDVRGMKKSPFFTHHIDLNQDIQQILDAFDKGTAYEVRRAERDGVTFRLSDDLEGFINFFNDFAKTKGIETTSGNYMNYKPALVITQAVLNDEILVMHTYVADGNRTRLHMSASKRITDDNKLRALVGFANRYLHFKDIEYFKNEGYSVYDMGGYAEGTDNPALIGINKFKAGFGGKLVKEFNYSPKWL